MTTETRREPPSLDIYEGREPIEGHGIPEVPGTPRYAPMPEKPRRGRRTRKEPAPEPEAPPKPLPGQRNLFDAPEAD
jgi:hypothetical protein